MKWVLGRRDGLMPALRSIGRGVPKGASAELLAQRREALYDAIEQTQAFMHKRASTDAFMEKLRYSYPAPLYFLESSRQALERAGVSRLDAFYYALIPALTRTCMSQQWGAKPRLDNVGAMGEYLKTLYVGVHVECFYLVLLTASGILIDAKLMQRGTVDSAPFYQREVLASVVNREAKAAVLCHNHPGGTLRPSREDLVCTLNMLNAMAALGIPLLDHVIVARGQAVSIRETGLVPEVLWTAQAPKNRLNRSWLDMELLKD